MVNLLTIKAIVHTVQGEPAENIKFRAEYYDPNILKWVLLIEDTLVDMGNYKAVLDPGQGAPEPDTLLIKIGDAIAKGTFPAVRVVHSTPIDPSYPEIIGFGGVMFYDVDATEFTIDMGELFLHEDHHIQEQIDLVDAAGVTPDYFWRASPRPFPGSSLEPALWAAMAQTSIFAGFDPNLTYQFIEDTGSSSDDLLAQIAALTSANETLTAEKAALEEEIVDLNAQIAALTAGGGGAGDGTGSATSNRSEAPQTLYRGFVEEMAAASAALPDSRYQISNMSLDLKVLATNDVDTGLQLQLVNDEVASSVNADALSLLRMTISPRDFNAVNTATNPLPDLIGLTETEARKRLQFLGLKMKAVYQMTDQHVIGQAFKQSPASTTQIIEGSTVTVIFAKNKEEFS